MKKLDLECLKYISQDTLDNIEFNYEKIVGIETNLNIKNENRKNVGRVLLFNGSKKHFLNTVVEFKNDKIKWTSNIKNGNKNLVLVNPYFVKSYHADPKLEVPVTVYDPKLNCNISEMRTLNYKQFMKNRLYDYYADYSYKFVAAYENFYYLMKNNPYYFAINSTVKNYRIPQDDLKKIISAINNKKKEIKEEWFSLMKIHIQRNENAKNLQELYNEFQENKVVNLKS